MNLKNDISEQKEYLEKNLEQLNTVVSDILGYKTKLEIEECSNGIIAYFKLVDRRNLKEKCGFCLKI